MSLGVVNVLLVERPPDALRDPALDLPLDVTRVDCASDVLRGDETQYRHLAGLGIDFDVAELGGKARRDSAGVYRRRGDDRSAGLRPLGRNLSDRQRREVADIAARRLGATVLPDHTVRIDVPHLGRPDA